MIGFVFINSTFAQKSKKDKKNKATTTVEETTKKDSTDSKPKPLYKSINEVTKNCKKYDGLFNIYQDTTNGKAYIEVSADKIGKEFIYFAHSMNGVIEAGYVKGGYRDNSIFKVEQYFGNINFRLQNTNFYFDPNNALSKVKDANINSPLFLSEKILAQTDNNYLVSADDLFLSETITQIKRASYPGSSPTEFKLGSLSKDKTNYIAIKNYPENTDVAVEYVYQNPMPLNYGGDEVTDARYVSIKMQHSIIAVPENNYQPRNSDPRVGYFDDKITDQTTTDEIPYRDQIHRWYLEKKDSNAALSEPVKPIVWWIENTTPESFRPIIKEAVLEWNKSFEKAGFKNAVEVYIQPDTASWDAEDIRYNVLRWTSSPRPPFGGYGPSFVNPRTGQILGADIMLEHIFLTNRLIYEKLFDLTSQNEEEHNHNYNQYECMAGQIMNENMATSMAVLTSYGLSDIDKDKFLRQALKDLIMHEVGHTMGLSHNFIASQMNTLEQVYNKDYSTSNGLTASVMDYTVPNIVPEKIGKQSVYFDDQTGHYDDWAIQYGYTVYNSPEAEKIGLQQILSQSIKPEHRFFNDGDDMRSTGKGIDPRVMIYDMSDDAISYAANNTEMMNDAIAKLLDIYGKDTASYQPLRNAFLMLSSRVNTNMTVVSRYIGGVYIDRSFANQNSPNKPYTPVPLATQKKAMSTLAKYLFAPDAFDCQEPVLNYIQYQRRGYLRGTNEDVKLHDRIAGYQDNVLNQLLHPTVTQRIVDASLYGDEYSINDMMTDLTNAIFSADLGKNVNTIRQNLQGLYIEKLLSIIDKDSYSFPVKSAAFAQVNTIEKWMKANTGGDAFTKGHRSNLLHIINDTLSK